MAYPLLPFLMLQAALWCTASLGYFRINGFHTDPAGLVFTLAFVFGHIPLFAWILGLLCLPFRLIGPRCTQLAAIVGGSVFSICLAIDLFIFSQYRFHISQAMLELFFGPAQKDIFVFPAAMFYQTAAAIILLVAVEVAIAHVAKRIKFSKRSWSLLLGGWLLCFCTYNALYAWGQFMRVPSIVAQRKVLPLAYPLSANRQLRKWGLNPKTDPYTTTRKGTLQYPKYPLKCPVVSRPPNILILLVDAWRADTFSPEIMPRLSGWAQRKKLTVFPQHLSGGNATAGGMFSLFYSIPPSYWDDVTALNLSPLVISHILSAGYEPGIFASSKLNSPTFDRNIFSAIKNLRLGSQAGKPWTRDVEAIDDFAHFLQTRNAHTPFFGFIFLDAPHGYSYPPEDNIFSPAKELNYLLLNNNTDPQPYFNHYKNSVHFIDRMIDRTLSLLQQYKLFDNTIILISADHGQELNDSRRNFWGHNGNFTDYQVHVPLLVHFPGRAMPAQVNYRTTHYDIVPTLLQTVFQCTNPPADYSIGYNLLDPTPRPFTVFSGYEQKAIRIGDTILVMNQFGAFQQYDPTFKPVAQTPEAATFKEGLKTFSQFYK